MRARASTVALLVAAAIAASCRRAEEQSVIIEVSPTFAATGLPRQLAAAFSAEAHVPVELRITLPPAAPVLKKERQADLALVESDDLQATLRRTEERLAGAFAFDDFLIVGPRRDRARVQRASSAPDGLKAVLRRRQTFCSPVNVPMLHDREMLIWAAAGIDPAGERRYRPCKGDAASALRQAAERSAYTITDRATFDGIGDIGLSILLQKTAMLHNDYTAVLLGSRERNPNAEWFYQWLMSYRGRDVIESYRFDGQRRFYVSEH